MATLSRILSTWLTIDWTVATQVSGLSSICYMLCNRLWMLTSWSWSCVTTVFYFIFQNHKSQFVKRGTGFFFFFWFILRTRVIFCTTWFEVFHLTLAALSPRCISDCLLSLLKTLNIFVIVLSKCFSHAPAMIIRPNNSFSRIRQTECNVARWQSVFYSENYQCIKVVLKSSRDCPVRGFTKTIVSCLAVLHIWRQGTCYKKMMLQLYQSKINN